MRIISGVHKGRRITAPKNLPIRPTTDFAKEALFNILNNRFHFKDLVVIDLFSGSGNIAYEFGSRGSGPITAIDENFECVKFINKTAGELDLDITSVKSDVFKYLEKAPVKADIIFADPPYDFDVDALTKLVTLTFEKDLLREEGELIIEHTKRIDLSGLAHYTEVRKYGNSVFSFFS